MKSRPHVRSLLASVAIAAAVALAGCDNDGNSPSLRSLQPLSPQMIAELDKRNMAKESPILVRIFKEESELEVWKQDNSGRFALLKTYPICRWSGELGPKIKEGDRQAPEGFYTITPSLMNPNSSYYLAINTGFPNAYDRANGRTGAFLMIHGDCSSSGCYAMTDEQIAEIYALARESFFGGQRAFQLQAFPFRMTPLNMAKHRNSPNMAFWRMLKEGYDHFEVSRLEPKVDVCERRYVFDAETDGKFTPAGKCPAYRVNDDLVAAVREKQQRDDRQMADWVSRGTATVQVRTGTDGGMHPTFLAAFQKPYTDSAGVVRSPRVSLPGTIPPHARPPREATNADPTGSVTTAAASRGPTRVAAAAASGTTSAGASGGLFSGLFSSSGSNDQQGSSGTVDQISRLMGFRDSNPAPSAPPAKSTPAPKPAQTAAAKPKPAAEPSSKPATAPAARPAPKPPTVEANAEPPPRPSSSASLINGAQPSLPSGSFESRWDAFR